MTSPLIPQWMPHSQAVSSGGGGGVFISAELVAQIYEIRVLAYDSYEFVLTVVRNSIPTVCSFTSGIGATEPQVRAGLLADVLAKVGSTITVTDTGTAIRMEAQVAGTGFTTLLGGRVYRDTIQLNVPPLLYPTDNYDKSFLVGSPYLDDDGDTSHDRRIFFDKAVASFRAGRFTDSRRDLRGKYSIAMGDNAYAPAKDAIALGPTAWASADAAFAAGDGAEAESDSSVAIGLAAGAYAASTGPSDWRYQTVIGTLCVSKNKGGTALGYNSRNLATYGLVIGYNGYTRAASKYATIIGGAWNQVDALGAMALGGYYNKAYGAWSVVSGTESQATAAGDHGFALGYKCTVQASYGFALGHYTVASGNYAHAINSRTIAKGYGSHARGLRSYAAGHYSAATGLDAHTWLQGQLARASASNSTNQGDPQESFVDAIAVTTAAAPTEILIAGTDRVTFPAEKTWGFRLRVTARQVAGAAGTVGDSAYFEFAGCIKLVGTTTTLVGSSAVGTPVRDDAAWTVALSADDTNDALKIDVTGVVDKTIRWAAFVHLFEVGVTV